MEQDKLENILQDAIPVVLEAGAYIFEKSFEKDSLKVDEKFKNNLVSIVDKEAERLLVAGLSSVLPNAGFITEEETIKSTPKEWMWVIDPLDGTTNFLRGVPAYSVSVALMKGKELMIGIVYNCALDNLFWATKGGGCFQDGEPISVTKKPLKDSLLATGFPYYDYDRTAQYLSVLEIFMRETIGLRRLGSAALDLCYVANGTFDGFFEYSLNAWDVAAGALIVKEAGGLLSDFNGGENFIFGKEILATNSVNQADIFKIVKQGFSSN